MPTYSEFCYQNPTFDIFSTYFIPTSDFIEIRLYIRLNSLTRVTLFFSKGFSTSKFRLMLQQQGYRMDYHQIVDSW
jgi:hypothetical protein